MLLTTFTYSWYFGAMSRQDATDLLMGEREGGVFLVRDSATIQVRMMIIVIGKILVMDVIVMMIMMTSPS